MAEIIRPPDARLLQVIADLRRDVDMLKRMPSGLKSIGPPHLSIVPAARANLSVDAPIPNATLTTVTWDAQHRDTADMFTPSSSRITAPIDGLYLAEGGVEFASNATGYRRMFLITSGSGIIPGQGYAALSGTATILTLSATIEMTAGQFLEAQVFQNSTVALNATGGTLRTYMALTWIGNV